MRYSSVPGEYGTTPAPGAPGSYDLSPTVVHERPTGFSGYMQTKGPLILDLVNLGLGITGVTLGTIAILDDDDDAS